MKVLAEFILIPMGVSVSISPYIAACQKVLQEAELKYQLHANGTNIEGEWESVMAAVKRCHEVVHEMGAPRISSHLRLGTRVDKAQTLEDKVLSVKSKIK